MKVKDESEKVGLKPNIHKIKIMASGSILLSQDCFGYLRFFYFHTNREII